MNKYAKWICLLFFAVSCGDSAENLAVNDAAPVEDAMDVDESNDGLVDDSSENDAIPTEEVTTECTVDSDCEASLTLRPCESAHCADGVCMAKEGPLCCEQASDCDSALFPESDKDCIETVCEDSICQSAVTAEPCCLSDESCSEIETACCEAALCEDFTCVVKPLDNCCAEFRLRRPK